MTMAKVIGVKYASEKLTFDNNDSSHLRDSKLKTDNPMKYKKLQTIFTCNTSALRSHVAHQGMDHYNVYRKGCLKLQLTMNERAMPEEELNQKNGIEVAMR